MVESCCLLIRNDDLCEFSIEKLDGTDEFYAYLDTSVIGRVSHRFLGNSIYGYSLEDWTLIELIPMCWKDLRLQLQEYVDFTAVLRKFLVGSRDWVLAVEQSIDCNSITSKTYNPLELDSILSHIVLFLMGAVSTCPNVIMSTKT